MPREPDFPPGFQDLAPPQHFQATTWKYNRDVDIIVSGLQELLPGEVFLSRWRPKTIHPKKSQKAGESQWFVATPVA